EKRLLNSRIREHFLTKLYTHANFRIVKKSTSIRQLVRFHSENKLLLAAYNQKELKILGRIVANQEDVPFIQLIEFYLRALGGRGKDTIAKCHLCLDIRKHLVSKGDLEELKPKKFCQNL
ncbi:MAG: DUF1722 domain-containing protein, partial [Candidatus Bathyarchaeia archaeon]